MIRALRERVAQRLAAWLALAMAALAIGLVGGCASTPAADCVPDAIVHVGSDGSQLRALRFDGCAGTLALIGPVAEVAKPRWTVAHPVLPIVYAATDGDGREGSVVAYAVDRGSGALTKLGEVASGGAGATHLWLDLPSMTLLVSNFGGGSVSSIPIERDGRLGARVSTIRASGSGPHRRQGGPRAHGATIDPSGRHALVADLGADRVFVYGFDRATRVLSPDDATEPRAFAAAPGSGPRRAVFTPDGRFVVVLHELSGEIATLRWDAQRARLAPVQTLQVSSPEFKGIRSVSEIAFGHDGRFVYVGDRGENTLVVYRADAASGALTLVQRTRSGGDGPWQFQIDRSGRWLLVANHRSNTVNLFSIDAGSGMLTDTSQWIGTPAPVSVGFMP